jgi:hypothetical protein
MVPTLILLAMHFALCALLEKRLMQMHPPASAAHLVDMQIYQAAHIANNVLLGSIRILQGQEPASHAPREHTQMWDQPTAQLVQGAQSQTQTRAHSHAKYAKMAHMRTQILEQQSQFQLAPLVDSNASHAQVVSTRSMDLLGSRAAFHAHSTNIVIVLVLPDANHVIMDTAHVSMGRQVARHSFVHQDDPYVSKVDPVEPHSHQFSAHRDIHNTVSLLSKAILIYI